MKKIGTSDGKALVLLNSQEFSGLAGDTISNTPDDTAISLAPIQAKLQLVDAKVAELAELKTQCEDVIAKLVAIGI
jgi:hypothetical protein